MFSHFRPLFVGFLSLMLGIWFAELFREGKIWYFIVFLVVFGLIILLSFLKFIVKNKFLEKLFEYNKFTILTFLCFLVGASLYLVQVKSIKSENNFNIDSWREFEISGRVRNTPVIYENYCTFFIDDLYLHGEGLSYKLQTGMYVKMQRSTGDDIQKLKEAKAGDVIKFVGTARKVNVLGSDEVFSFAYKNNIRYFGNTDVASLKEVTKVEGEHKFFR